jgi:hypothetical protein
LRWPMCRYGLAWRSLSSLKGIPTQWLSLFCWRCLLAACWVKMSTKELEEGQYEKNKNLRSRGAVAFSWDKRLCWEKSCDAWSKTDTIDCAHPWHALHKPVCCFSQHNLSYSKGELDWITLKTELRLRCSKSILRPSQIRLVSFCLIASSIISAKCFSSYTSKTCMAMQT